MHLFAASMATATARGIATTIHEHALGMASAYMVVAMSLVVAMQKNDVHLKSLQLSQPQSESGAIRSLWSIHPS